MIPINLNPLDAAIYSSTRYQRAGWIIPLFLRFGCIGRVDLVNVTGISKDTAGKYLDDLAFLGIIVRQGHRDGFVLTVGGKQLVATMMLGTPAATQVEEVVDADEDPNAEGLNSPFENGGDTTDEQTENSAQAADAKVEGLNSPFASKNLESKILEEDLIKLNNDSSSLDSRKGLNSPFDKNRLLEAISILFDASIGTKVHPNMSLDDILAWIAKGWKERSNFNDPNGAVGMIYNRISEGRTPPSKFRRIYHEILPSSFFENAGLIKFSCSICELEFDNRAAFDTHGREKHAEPEALELDEQPERVAPDDSVTDRIRQVWQSVLQLLQADMPRASFDTWVRDTQVLSFKDGFFKIGARSAYACNWLTEHLSDTVHRILAGVMNNQNLTVVFATADLRSEIEDE